MHRIIARKNFPGPRDDKFAGHDARAMTLRMHKGPGWTVAVCTGFVLAVASWAALDPLIVRSARAELSDPATGRQVVCAASLAPAAGDPDYAVAMCVMACRARGFRFLSGDNLDIDFTSPEAARAAMERWKALYPPACRT